MQFENISGAYIKKRHQNVYGKFHQKHEWIDDIKVYVHAKFDMQQKICARRYKKMKSALVACCTIHV